MKKFILLKLIPFIAVCITNPVLAQDNGVVQTEHSRMNYVPSPQTWAFMKYGNTPVDYYTGTVQVNVPVYEYKDNDFDISVSVGYASNGLLPQRQTGILGLNWFLNCGGSVTREIRGVADDKTYGPIAGFIGSGDEYTDSEFMTYKPGGICGDINYMNWYVVGSNNVETESDVFHFSFMGHTGTFHYNRQQQVFIYNTNGNNGTYIIEYDRPYHEEILSFTIKTADGYSYVFGGSNESVERSMNGNFDHYGRYVIETGWVHPIVTWNLTKIIAPNGRTVSFGYMSDENYNHISSPNQNPYFVTSFSFGYNDVDNGYKFENVGDDDNTTNHFRRASVIKTSNLENVTIGNDDNRAVINLYYSKKCCREATATNDITDRPKFDAGTMIQFTNRLDSITVSKVSGKILKKCGFEYRVKDNHLILDAVNIDGLGKYRMTYFEDYPYPEISTADVDFWGYYNGKGNRSTNIVSTEIDSETYNEVVKPDNRSHYPDSEYSKTGCLKRMEYPTKGFTEFEYESNTAKYIVMKNKKPILLEFRPSDNDSIWIGTVDEDVYLAKLNFYRSQIVYTDDTGGVRIKKITDYDGLGGYNTREFEYSGGVVSSFPRFYAYKVGRFDCYNQFINFAVNSFDRGHIGYQTVKEKFADGSAIEYGFNTYYTHPDEYEEDCRKPIFNDVTVADSLFVNNISRVPNSRDYQRGKMNRVTYYDNLNHKVRCEYLEYADHNAADSNNYSAFVVLSGRYAYFVKRFTGDYRLVNKTVTDYFGIDSLTTVTTINYNDIGQIRKTEIRYPDGRVKGNETEYEHENGNSAAASQNMLDYPRTICETVSNEHGKRILSVSRYNYSTVYKMLKPSSVYNLKSDVPVEYPFNESAYGDKFKRIVSYGKYDSRGNPVQVMDDAGVITSYIWGYGGLYPVVKAVGTTFDALKNILGLMSDAPLDAGLSDEQKNALSNASNMLVDIYDYEPHVGITGHIDPSGHEYAFEYDSYGRLIMKKDDAGIIEKYEYHIE